MLIISVTISISTAIIELFRGREFAVIIPYGIIIPFVLFLPRILYYSLAPLRRKSNFLWVDRAELLSFFLVLLNAPASLYLHQLAFQYDRFLHFAASVVVLIFASLIISPIVKYKRFKSLILAISASLVLLFVWEVFQYLADAVFDTSYFFDYDQNLVLDFWEDILYGVAGLIGGTMFIYFYYEFIRSTAKK